MSKVFTVIHHKKEQNTIALNGRPYCEVFDDRWQSGNLDPRSWQVRLNRNDYTLIQLEFLWKSQDVRLTTHDLREAMLEKKGMVKKHFDMKWNGDTYHWHKSGTSYTLACDDGTNQVIATREDTGNTEGLITTVTIMPNKDQTIGMEDEVILASALCIGAANVDGGVLSSRPPTGIWMATGGRIAVTSHPGYAMPAAQQ